MPPLEKEHDTYIQFFSIESWQELCRTAGQREVLRILADRIPDAVQDEILAMRSRGELEPRAEAEDSSAIPSLAEKLAEIVRKFRDCQEGKVEFTTSFPGFRETRKKSVEKLRNVGVRIVLGRLSATGIGSCAGVLEAVTMACCSPSLPLVGGLAGSSVEEALLRADVRSARAVIEEDNASTPTFSRWQQQTLELLEVLRQVMDVDLLQTTVQDFASVLQVTFPDGQLEPLLRRVRAFANAYMRDVGGMHATAYWINVLSLIAGFVFALISIQSRDHEAVTTGLWQLRDGGLAVANSAGRAASVGMVMDTATVLLTAIDNGRGSRRREDALRIAEVAVTLQQDLALMQRIYDELQE